MEPNCLSRAAMGLAAAAIATPAWAQGYPARPITMIVPFAAGGSADVYARLLAPPLQAALGQPPIVDDRAGAGPVIGTEYVKNAPADGYTLVLVTRADLGAKTVGDLIRMAKAKPGALSVASSGPGTQISGAKVGQ